jgi:hypothetical protein
MRDSLARMLCTIIRGLSSERPSRPHCARLCVEQLEARNVPSVTWTNGDHNSQWGDALNWYDDVSKTNHVPGPSDNAVINFGHPIITGAVEVATITGGAWPVLAGPIVTGNSSLTVDQSANIGYLYLQDGSSLIAGSSAGAMAAPLAGPPPPVPFSISQFIIAGNVDLRGRTIIEGTAFGGSPPSGVPGTINIYGNVTLAGGVGAYINVLGISGASLTVVSGGDAFGIDNRSGPGTGGGLFFVDAGVVGANVLNELGAQTTITDDAGVFTHFISFPGFNNQGTLVINQAASGEVDIDLMIAGTGDPFTHSSIIINGGTVMLGGTDPTPELLSGAVSVQTGSTLFIEGEFTFAALSVTGAGAVEVGADVVVDSSLGGVSFSNLTLGGSMEILAGSTLSINTVGGTFTTLDQSILIFDIGPSSTTPFGVSGQLVDPYGTVTLSMVGAGFTTIDVELVDGFVPSVHQDFPLVTAQSIITTGGTPAIGLPPGFTYALTNTNLDALV